MTRLASMQPRAPGNHASALGTFFPPDDDETPTAAHATAPAHLHRFAAGSVQRPLPSSPSPEHQHPAHPGRPAAAHHHIGAGFLERFLSSGTSGEEEPQASLGAAERSPRRGHSGNMRAHWASAGRGDRALRRKSSAGSHVSFVGAGPAGSSGGGHWFSPPTGPALPRGALASVPSMQTSSRNGISAFGTRCACRLSGSCQIELFDVGPACRVMAQRQHDAPLPSPAPPPSRRVLQSLRSGWGAKVAALTHHDEPPTAPGRPSAATRRSLDTAARRSLDAAAIRQSLDAAPTRSISRFLTAGRVLGESDDGGKDAEPVPMGKRLWGVVRDVVFADYDSEGMRLAFEHVHARGGRRNSTVMNPAKFLQAWKQARVVFMWARLRGEWFPKALVEAKPPRRAPPGDESC